MNRVFVSYSRRNESFAERIARDLADAGLEVWFDRRQIQGGENWRDEIFRGLERSDFLVVCLSPPAVASEWVAREVKTVRDQGKPIFPIMVQDAFKDMSESENFKWLLDYQFINFEERYEEAFPQLLEALPGGRAIGTFDILDPEKLPNPFKGLEAFQQRDSQFFFGREEMIARAIEKMKRVDFLAVVGASGSGKSSMVRAGLIPQIRNGALPGSEKYPIMIFTPGEKPIESFATRLHPLLQKESNVYTESVIAADLHEKGKFARLVNELLSDFEPETQLVMVIDQFEEVFTRAGETEREPFLAMLNEAALDTGNRVEIIITMRSDFFGHLSRYPDIAKLFEGEHLLIVTEMTPANLLRAIEGPAKAVNLEYEKGLADQILNEVQSQPGSLPLLQYALRELFKRRDGLKLTKAAYEEIGGVRQALARHAEGIYQQLSPEKQAVMQRVLLRLIEVGESGEATRRRVPNTELRFRDIPDEAVQSIVDLLTAPEARLLIANREIQTGSSAATNQTPIVWIEVSHEALIREWDRFKTWVSSSAEDLRYESELRKAAADWENSGRDTAYLLRGKRLTRAEIWIDNADPTKQQSQLIEASMKARIEEEEEEKARLARELELQQQATNRLRLFVGGLAVFLVVAVILGMVALNSANKANALADQLSQTNVELQRTAAESQSLALTAGAEQSFTDGDISAAVALAVAANAIENPLPQAQRSLGEIGLAPGIEQILTSDTDVTYSRVAISPDGTTILASITDSNSIWRWTVGNDAPGTPFATDFAGAIRDIRYSPDGSVIAVALSTNEDNLLILDATTGDIQSTWNEQSGGINSVRFSPDGAFLLSASDDNTVAIIDLNGYGLVNRIESYTDTVTTLAISADGQILASGTETGSIFLHRMMLPSVAPLPVPGGNGNAVLDNDVSALALNADGTQLIAGDNRGHLVRISLEAATLTEIPSLEVPITGIVFIEGESDFAVGASDGELRLWDIDTLRQTDSFNNEESITHLVVDSSGTQIVTGGDTTLHLWDIDGSEQIQRYAREDNSAFSIALRPDGTQAVSSSSDGAVLIWNVIDGTFFEQVKTHEGLITYLTYSADSTVLVSGGIDKTVKVWSSDTYETLQTFDQHQGGVLSIAVTDNGSTVASSGSDGTLFVWDVASGDELAVMQGWSNVRSLVFTEDESQLLWIGTPPESSQTVVALWNWQNEPDAQILYDDETPRSVAINAAGDQLAIGLRNGEIVLADAAGNVTRQWEAHDNRVENIFFIPEGDSIVSGSVDGTISLWDLDTGLELRRYLVLNESGRTVGLRNLALSGDGQTVLSGMNDNSARLWLLVPNIDDLLEWTRANRSVRPISCEERQAFGIEPLCEDA